MTPEILEEIDAARDALALLDATIDGDNAAAWFVAGNWSDRGDVLLRHLLAAASTLCRNVATLTDSNPHQIVGEMRRATLDAERTAANEG